MLKILDFLYYFMFQLHRRGYKENIYENTQFFLGYLLCVIFIPLSIIFYPFIQVITNNFSFTVYSVCIIITIFVASYFLTSKYYGPNGSRNKTVEIFDKKYNIRKQNQYLQIFIIVTIMTILFIVCGIINHKIKRYLGLE